ncbi:MAG: hypothetical protein NT018_00035 [Armatimonadetes bacterium]|nr:hypothetical protein [Armatimonadota bacterium]
MSIRLSTIDIVIVIAYLAVVVTLGTVMKRSAAKNIGSYFLGGRQLPWWALAMSARRFGKAYSLRSLLSILVGIPWIISLYLLPTYLALHRYNAALITLAIVAAGCVALYFSWYRGLDRTSPLLFSERTSCILRWIEQPHESWTTHSY